MSHAQRHVPTNRAAPGPLQVRNQISHWFPRPEEYSKYIHWDEDKSKYTRNLIYGNEYMDVLLMCWPPGSKSAIHSHDDR